jgi:hypothetical protein
MLYLLSTTKKEKNHVKTQKEEKEGKKGRITERVSITGIRHRRSMRSTVDDTSRSNVVDDGSPSSSVQKSKYTLIGIGLATILQMELTWNYSTTSRDD